MATNWSYPHTTYYGKPYRDRPDDERMAEAATGGYMDSPRIPVPATPDRPGNMSFQRSNQSGTQRPGFPSSVYNPALGGSPRSTDPGYAEYMAAQNPPVNDYRSPQAAMGRNTPYMLPQLPMNPNRAIANVTNPSYLNMPGIDQRADLSQQRIASIRNAPTQQIPYPESTSPAMAAINQLGGMPKLPFTPTARPTPTYNPNNPMGSVASAPYLRQRYEDARTGAGSLPDNVRGDVLRQDTRSGVPLDQYAASDVLMGRGDRGNDRLQIPFAQTQGFSQNQQEILQGDRRINYGPDQSAPVAPVIPLDRRPNADIYREQLIAANSPSGRRDESFRQAAPGYIPMGRDTQQTRAAESEQVFRDRQNERTGFRDAAQEELANAAERRSTATEARMSQPNRARLEERRRTAQQAEETAYGRERQAEQDALTTAERQANIDLTNRTSDPSAKVSNQRTIQTPEEMATSVINGNNYIPPLGMTTEQHLEKLVQAYRTLQGVTNQAPSQGGQANPNAQINVGGNQNMVPPAAAIKKLQENPALAPWFDKQYGKDQAKIYLPKR